MKPKTLNEKVVETIIELREGRNLSQEKMASLVNMSKSSYIRLEKGNHAITLDEADKIAEVLQTNFASLTNAGNVYNNHDNKIVYNQGNVIVYNIDKESFDDLLSKSEVKK